ncbi:uncharacterized protein F5Z01DRAFT_649865 [Emericellopsis atlantica]|uniref:Cytochrome b5 heme-binding domain-containing protein n=1 Tax=Emericellopsis atlantica TaxID=2614577 RepID=A0A9P7ZQF8_9HYPO|nr:uncharacterized protein F5Z01DRAFT_649865 [Emericellopsis atlantica]KAG9256315.1 hypothetical protein F5Z01DRAFT_649865 [Emericellopsis atlantica]
MKFSQFYPWQEVLMINMCCLVPRCREYEEQARTGHDVIIDHTVNHVEGFVREHPGGATLVRSGMEKDATGLFDGDVYGQSHAGRNLLSSMRMAVATDEP